MMMIVVRRTLEELNAALAGAILETPFARVSMVAFNRKERVFSRPPGRLDSATLVGTQDVCGVQASRQEFEL